MSSAGLVPGGTDAARQAPRVALVVTGGIAAYKACELLRALQRVGADVRVCMTADAERFVGKATFEALSKHPVADDLYAYPDSPIPHVWLADWADAVVVCPATANVLAKMAAGIADDCATAVLLAATAPVVVAPAMNVHMWQNAATQANLATLRGRGVRVVEPATGLLACGDVGQGKLADVADVAAATRAAASEQDLAGLGVLVTAGPTHEAIDPVRYIANGSSGKTGYAIAAEAARRGAQVTLVSGPTALPCPWGVTRVDVTSAAEMLEASLAAFDAADVAVCAAAVADYRPAVPAATHKLKKGAEGLGDIRLVETADILATLAARKGARVVVGFAAETDDLLANAQDKLRRKGCDLIVANDVSRADSAFGSDTRRAALVSASGVEELPTLPLDALADAVLDRARALRGA